MLHKLSLLMTGLIMMMGAAWFGLHTYGAPEPDERAPQDIDVAETRSERAAAMQTAEHEETNDIAEESKKAALMIARAKLNAQLIADAAPVTAAVVEMAAPARKPAVEAKPVEPKPVQPKPAAVKPVAAKAEAKKPTPVTAKKEAAPPVAPKPAAAKPAPPKADAAKPKSIDDILDSLD